MGVVTVGLSLKIHREKHRTQVRVLLQKKVRAATKDKSTKSKLERACLKKTLGFVSKSQNWDRVGSANTQYQISLAYVLRSKAINLRNVLIGFEIVLAELAQPVVADILK